MILRVENGMDQSFFFQSARKHFARLDGNRADEHRTALRVQRFDFPDDGIKFFAPRFVNRIIRVLADVRSVRRDGHHAELVDVVKFRRLGLRRAGHAREFGVKAEIILDRDRGERLRFTLNGHAFFGFDGLMQSVAPAAAGHQAPRVFIHDDDLVILHDVFDFVLIQGIRLEQLRDRVNLLRLGLKVGLQLRLRFEPFASVGFRPRVHIV